MDDLRPGENKNASSQNRHPRAAIVHDRRERTPLALPVVIDGKNKPSTSNNHVMPETEKNPAIITKKIRNLGKQHQSVLWNQSDLWNRALNMMDAMAWIVNVSDPTRIMAFVHKDRPVPETIKEYYMENSLEFPVSSLSALFATPRSTRSCSSSA